MLSFLRTSSSPGLILAALEDKKEKRKATRRSVCVHVCGDYCYV